MTTTSRITSGEELNRRNGEGGRWAGVSHSQPTATLPLA